MAKGSGVSVAEMEDVECSMCGDVGLQDKLFLCKTRGCHRHQHTYCSNWYPEERSGKAGMCNWCAAAACSSSDKANMQETTSRIRAEASSAPAAMRGGTTNSGPLKIIISNNSGNNNNNSSGSNVGKPKVAGCKNASATRTPPGRRYKLVSEM